MGIKNSTIVQLIFRSAAEPIIPSFVTPIIITRAIMEKSMLTKANITFSKGKIYLGIYTFLIRGAFPTMETIAEDVASFIKLKIKEPVR